MVLDCEATSTAKEAAKEIKAEEKNAEEELKGEEIDSGDAGKAKTKTTTPVAPATPEVASTPAAEVSATPVSPPFTK
jgi:hypothetical protein